LSTVGVLIVCLVPPFLLSLWKVIPFMSKIRHLFYFYTQYWQLLVALLAGVGMEALLRLRRDGNATVRRNFVALISGLMIIALLVMIGYSTFSQKVPANDPGLEANLRVALIVLITGMAILQWLLFPTAKNRRIFVLIILAVALTDLTRYFWEVSRADRSFTDIRWGLQSPLPSEIQTALGRRWAQPDLQQGFKSNLFENMPVRDEFWPINTFMSHQYVVQLKTTPEEFQKKAFAGPPLEFYVAAVQVPDSRELNNVIASNPELFASNKVLLLHGDSNPELQTTPPALNTADAAPLPGFVYQFREWQYNAFQFEVTAPQAGWLLIRQLNDPEWELTLDAQPVKPVQADLTGMALPLIEGRHQIHMEYRPLARRLYRTACLLLELTLLGLFTLSVLSSTSQHRLVKPGDSDLIPSCSKKRGQYRLR
jgi:hypothetical protein